MPNRKSEDGGINMPALSSLRRVAIVLSLTILRFVLILGSIDDRDFGYPIAPHRLFVVPSSSSFYEMSLPGYDLTGAQLEKTTIASLPTNGGSLYQLSRIYNDHGYEPKAQANPVNQSNTDITGKGFRILYNSAIISGDNMPYGKLDSFTYTTKVIGRQQSSTEGRVTLVPPSGIIVGSSFARDAEGWEIIGNRLASDVVYDRTSRGLQSRYIYGSDDVINRDTQGHDRNLWYFKAPSNFLGNQGIAYGGQMSFTLSSFSGDFSSANLNNQAYLVYLECSTCNSNAGVRLGMPLSSAFANGEFSGLDTKVSLSLKEDGGWKEDSKNSLQAWTKPSRCTFIQVLSSLSGVSILGDFTRWHESIGLDNVALINTKEQLPKCAQGSPNAHLCTCT